MLRHTLSRSGLRVALLSAGLAALIAPLAATPAPAAYHIPIVTDIRAAHHPGFDRLVFEFANGLPTQHTAAYVSAVPKTPNGYLTLPGSAFLQVRFFAADAHDAAARVTVPRQVTYALPNLTKVVVAEDFEGYVRFGVALQRRTTIHVSTLTSPARFVVDIATPFTWRWMQDYFIDGPNATSGQGPLTHPVARPIIPSTYATQLLYRLFAGPTAAERADGARLVRSKATGFSHLSISSGVARLWLTGGCSSGGSTTTIADEIMPTLKQLSSVSYVKIYGPAGHTERPYGASDSIPTCLEP